MLHAVMFHAQNHRLGAHMWMCVQERRKKLEEEEAQKLAEDAARSSPGLLWCMCLQHIMLTFGPQHIAKLELRHC